MTTYVVPVTYEFEVTFRIDADTAEEARVAISEHCGALLRNIHTTLPDSANLNWLANTHPNKTVGFPIEVP